MRKLSSNRALNMKPDCEREPLSHRPIHLGQARDWLSQVLGLFTRCEESVITQGRKLQPVYSVLQQRGALKIQLINPEFQYTN